MKILCPVDFSEASLNAFTYALKLGDLMGASLVEVTHCDYHARGRKVEDPMAQERLLQDKLTELERTYQDQHDFKIGSSLFKGHPLDVFPPYLNAMGHELVVVGTRGLTPVRDMTIGSFTEDLIFALDRPILVVPQAYLFESLSNIVLAIDNQPISTSSTIQMLPRLAKKTEANIHVVHVKEDQVGSVNNLTSIDRHLDNINYDFHSVPVEDSLTKTLDHFCMKMKADLLCMVHRDRGWMINIFHRSSVKEELFHLKTPLLVLSE